MWQALRTSNSARHGRRFGIWHPSEADVLFDIRRRPGVARWLGDPTPWSTLDQAEEAIADWRERATFAVPSNCAVVPDATGVPVGGVSLNRMPTPGAGEVAVAEAPWLAAFAPIAGVDDPSDSEVETGWFLHPDAVGNGWATEAATAMLEHAFAHGLERVWAVMWAHNAPSAAVCRRLGMCELGVEIDPWYGTTADPDSRFFLASPA